MSTNSQPFTALAGALLLGIAALWSATTPWLSANLVISVWTELAAYWLSLIAVLVGGFLCFGSHSRPRARIAVFRRCLCVAFPLVVVVASWHWSNEQFFYWKMRAIPSNAWPQMVSDLETIGREVAQKGNNRLPWPVAPRESLHQLGLRQDYSGGMSSVLNSPEYSGVFAFIVFGNKVRSWGLFLGTERHVKKYCRGGTYTRVAPNAFFFVGSRD